MKPTMNWIGIALLCLGTCSPVVWSRTWTVGQPNTPCTGATNTSIGDAINAASAGDVIEVCPALYPEQLLITKPLTLRGISNTGIGRVLVQPMQLQTVAGMAFTAVITVMNTSGVTIQNMAVDASNNTVAGCSVGLSGIHFYNASGLIDGDSISGARLGNPTSCAPLYPENGFGVQIDQDPNSTASYNVTVQNSSIHDFTRNGILVVGSGETVNIDNNSIAGVGPSSGGFQFGVFIAFGATGQVTRNSITQGPCGAISNTDCTNRRSEGVVLRSAGAGALIDGNFISNVQAGVFVNGATGARVTNNTISNVEVLNGIHIQGSVSGWYIGNRIFHVGPFTEDPTNEWACGVNDIAGTNSSANLIQGNQVYDAYCGVGYISGDQVQENVYQNTLYEALNHDDYPDAFPAPVEPGQAQATVSSTVSEMLRRVVRER